MQRGANSARSIKQLLQNTKAQSQDAISSCTFVRRLGFYNGDYCPLIWRFLANAHQRQIKDRIKICLHKDGFVLTAPDAKINTEKKTFFKKTPT